MATHLRYNTITLHNVTTRQFTQETIYDGSGTDQIGIRYTIKVEGLVHLQPAVDTAWRDDGLPWNVEATNLPFTGMVPQNEWTGQVMFNKEYFNNPTNNPGYLMQYVRARLLTPRAPLEFLVGGAPMLTCLPAVGQWLYRPDRDISNGPHPQDVTIEQIIGSQMYRISFTISCEKLECQNQLPVPWVLSNRWQISETLDSNFFTTRTISGTLRLSQSGVAWINDEKKMEGIAAESFRWMAVPALEVGFRREQFEYSVSRDGLTVNYTVMDRQVHTSAPWPATRMTVEHNESSDTGYMWVSSVQMELEGPPHVDKRLLIARMLQIADSKLQLVRRDKTKKYTYVPVGVTITDVIGEQNRVRSQWTIRRTGKNQDGTFEDNILGAVAGEQGRRLNLDGYPLPFATDINQIGYNPGRSQMPHPWGYDPQQGSNTGQGQRSPALLIAMQCYLQHPCIACHDQSSRYKPIDLPQSDTKGSVGDTTVKPSTVPSVATIDPRNVILANLAPKHVEAPYTHAVIENRYTYQRLLVQVPLSRSINDGQHDTCIVAQLGGGVPQREITYDATRSGEWPLIPQPEEFIDFGESLVGRLLHKEIALQPPKNTADGANSLYHLRARFVYALNREPRDDERLNCNSQPFLSYSSSDAEQGVILQEIYDPSMASGDEIATELPEEDLGEEDI